MSDLKPCPFCGGEVQRLETYYCISDDEQCECCTTYHFDCECGLKFAVDSRLAEISEEEANQRWNTRAEVKADE